MSCLSRDCILGLNIAHLTSGQWCSALIRKRLHSGVAFLKTGLCGLLHYTLDKCANVLILFTGSSTCLKPAQLEKGLQGVGLLCLKRDLV